MEDEVEILKKQGNDAFKLGKLDEAVQFYSHAIELAHSGNILAILFSNRAQAFLIQKKYDDALSDADKSLQHDPLFKKSVLRRGTAHFELGNYHEAAKDFRQIIRDEPKNSTALSLLKRIFPPVKMNTKFLEVYTLHALRCKFKKPHETSYIQWMQLEIGVKFALSRHLFTSTRYSPIFGRLLRGIEVFDEEPNQIPGIRLPTWFKDKWVCVANKPNNKIAIGATDQTLQLILNLTQPKESLLIIGTDKGIRRYAPLYNFEHVSTTPDYIFFMCHINPDAVPLIIKSAHCLTVLPCFIEMLQLKDNSFPKMKTLVIMGHRPPTLEFLKLWKQRKWKIREVFVEYNIPKMASFARFKGILSDSVTRMQMPLIDRFVEQFNPGQVSQFSTNMKTMKRLFPSLNEVIGVVVFDFNYETFPVVHGTHIDEHIAFLVDNITENVKPDWLPKLKVLLKFVVRHKPDQKIDIGMDYLQRIAKTGEKKSKLLQSIYLREKAVPTFDWSNPTNYHKLIEMSTTFADFQVFFEKSATL